jgi:DNA-binding MarR family transcriptional regulator
LSARTNARQLWVAATIDMGAYASIWAHMHLYQSNENLTMTTATLPEAENCNCFGVHSAARYVTQLYFLFLVPIGLRVTQFSILAKLKRRGGLTINALTDQMVMDRTTLGRAIQPLERDGLIRIGPAPSDRRATQLHLTKAGERRLQRGWRHGLKRRRASKQALASDTPASCERCCGRSLPANSRRQLKSRTDKSAFGA